MGTMLEAGRTTGKFKNRSFLLPYVLFVVQGSEVLDKYVALYAAHLIKSGKPVEALSVFSKHGAPGNIQNFNIYKRLALDLFGLSTGKYGVWASLRDMMFALVSKK